MGLRGPKAQTAEIRALRSTNRSGAAVAPWPLAAKLPKMPRHLYGHGAKLWRTLGPQLVESGLLCELYAHSFAALCAAMGHALELEEELRAAEPKDKPALRRLLIQQRKLTIALSREFGLSPDAKGRVQAERRPAAEPSGWDDFK